MTLCAALVRQGSGGNLPCVPQCVSSRSGHNVGAGEPLQFCKTESLKLAVGVDKTLRAHDERVEVSVVMYCRRVRVNEWL